MPAMPPQGYKRLRLILRLIFIYLRGERIWLVQREDGSFDLL